MEISGISVVVLETARAVTIRAQVELASALRHAPDALVSFAGGTTFAPFFAELEKDVAVGRLDLSRLRVTHPDEFAGFGPHDAPGFAHELLRYAPFRQAHDEGRFVPVPAAADDAGLRAHAAAVARLGGVTLQFLGIGGNGHIAYAEPGTPLDRGFHRARLAPATRSALASRFAPAPVPEEAITAGPATVFAARRLVLVATGAGKARAVRDMMERDVGPGCPASIVRRHPDALVLLDSAAAVGLDWPEFATAAGR